HGTFPALLLVPFRRFTWPKPIRETDEMSFRRELDRHVLPGVLDTASQPPSAPSRIATSARRAPMPRSALFLPLLASAAVCSACGEQKPPPSPAPAPGQGSPSPASAGSPLAARPGSSAAYGLPSASVAGVDGGASPYEGPYAGATVTTASI